MNFVKGIFAADKWAKNVDPEDLIQYSANINDAVNRYPRGIIDLLETVQDGYTAGERLYFVLFGVKGEERDRGRAAGFWQSICGKCDPDSDFVRGFADSIRYAAPSYRLDRREEALPPTNAPHPDQVARLRMLFRRSPRGNLSTSA